MYYWVFRTTFEELKSEKLIKAVIIQQRQIEVCLSTIAYGNEIVKTYTDTVPSFGGNGVDNILILNAKMIYGGL